MQRLGSYLIFFIFSFFILLESTSQAKPELHISPCNLALHDLSEQKTRTAIFQERFLKPLITFEKMLLSSTSVEKKAMQLIEGNFRLEFFKVKALFEFYEDTDWIQSIQTYQEKIKNLEDLLGVCVDIKNWLALSEQLQMPEAVTQILAQDFKIKKEELKNLLIEDGWIPNKSRSQSTLNAFISDLNEINAPTQKEDAAFIKKELKTQLKLLHEADLDMKNLPDGVHRLRRKIRSIPILLMALLGKIQMTDEIEIPQKLLPFQKLDESQKKYLQMEITHLPLKQVIPVKRSTVVAFNYFIFQLGALKDAAEIKEAFLSALLRAKLFPNEAKAESWLTSYLKEKLGWQEFYPRAKNHYDSIIKSDLLLSLF